MVTYLMSKGKCLIKCLDTSRLQPARHVELNKEGGQKPHGFDLHLIKTPNSASIVSQTAIYEVCIEPLNRSAPSAD